MPAAARGAALARSMAPLALAATLLAPSPAAGAQAGPLPASAMADSLLERGLVQEAAWAARAAGDTARADSLVAWLESVLRSQPLAVRPLSMDSQGVSYTLRVRHDAGVSAIFKVDGSDIFCTVCGADREVAAYRIDRLLGLDLTPVTVFQTVVLDGDTLRGSSMYFVQGARPSADEAFAKPDRLRFFDAVLGNSDRHGANWLYSSNGAVVAIDHNRAFEYRPTTRPKTCWETEVDAIVAPAGLGRPYHRYRTLPADSLRAAVADVLAPALADEFVAMRDRVVRRIEARIDRPNRQQPLSDCVRNG